MAQQQEPFQPREQVFQRIFKKYVGDNGYEDLVLAADIAGRSRAFALAELSEPTLREMREATDDPNIDRALQMLHAALDKPIRLPRDLSTSDENTIYPEFAGFRRLARALSMKMQVQFADGRVSRAIETLKDGMRFSYLTQSEALISGLVGVAIDTIVLERFASHFDQMSVSDCAEIVALAQERLRQPAPLLVIFEHEHQIHLNILSACRSNPARLQEIVKMGMPEDAPESDSDLAAIELADYVNGHPTDLAALVDQATGLLNSYHQKIVSVLSKPPWERKEFPKLENRKTPAHRLCGLLLPFMGSVEGRFESDLARIHLLGVHAAIRRFQWEQNRLPASLADLKLPSLTVDPITGDPLVYRATGRSYTLHTAGRSGLGAAGAAEIYLPKSQ